MPNRRRSPFGALCPTQIGQWRYHNHSFEIPNNGIHKKLELHFGQATVTRPFFKFREEAFEWGDLILDRHLSKSLFLDFIVFRNMAALCAPLFFMTVCPGLRQYALSAKTISPDLGQTCAKPAWSETWAGVAAILSISIDPISTET